MKQLFINESIFNTEGRFSFYGVFFRYYLELNLSFENESLIKNSFRSSCYLLNEGVTLREIYLRLTFGTIVGFARRNSLTQSICIICKTA